MSKMLEGLKGNTNKTRTANNAVANESTLNNVVDLFARGGAVRNVPQNDVIKLVDRAYGQNKKDTLATVFYLLDVREGQGERRFGKIALKHLARQDPATVTKVLALIPEYSRWDMLYEFVGTSLQKPMFDLIAKQLKEDIETVRAGGVTFPSLMAKWLKSENTSSAESKRLGKLTRNALGLTPRQYRKILSQLRKSIGVIETLITTRNYDAINYKNVPSKAFMKYIKAFDRNDNTRFQEFMGAVKTGETKLRTQKVVHPHELVEMSGGLNYYSDTTKREAANELWKALPDYLEGTDDSILSCVDVSGSMSGLPMQVAIALGIYTAERNVGPFKDHILTFSANPKMQEVVGTDLHMKVKNLSKAKWDMNTDIEAMFMLILNTAVSGNLPQSELPNKLLILSDMEFDAARGAKSSWGWRAEVRPDAESEMTLMERIKGRFVAAGYEMPQLMFWNLDAQSEQFPMTATDAGSIMVSGFSPTILKYVMKGKFHSPAQAMYDVIRSERYAPIYKALS